MDPLPEREIIGFSDEEEEECERVLDRLRRNDPALKKLTLGYSASDLILKAFDAIATNSSLKRLYITGDVLLYSIEEKDRLTRALSLNTSLKDISIPIPLLDIVMASPNLEFLTLRDKNLSIEEITAMAQVLCGQMSLHSLTLERSLIESDMAAAFATALFQGNQTIKTLILRCSIGATGALSLLEALPHDHALEALVFDEDEFDDDSSVRIVRAVCRTPLKVLSLIQSRDISDECCTRIIQTLRENEHSLTKLDLWLDSQLDLWWDSQDYGWWQNFVRLEIEKLTWNNRLQVEKDAWVNRFLNQDAPTKELLFRALERAKKVDKEQCSEAPNILFYLIKESPDFIVQAIRDGL